MIKDTGLEILELKAQLDEAQYQAADATSQLKAADAQLAQTRAENARLRELLRDHKAQYGRPDWYINVPTWLRERTDAALAQPEGEHDSKSVH